MTLLNFSQIRNHDGSQDGGFEELVCQLAHLSPPDNADYFVRKEGAGGDAGVECYWKLYNGNEHGWQAKYFLDSLSSSQWAQISESVETALNKHPFLSKYYVCLPRDWTDSRKKGKNGKKVKSALDRWQEHVVQWEKLALSFGMEVEFVYWCKHEISQMLQTDKPMFSGRALYWFNEPILTNEHFNKVAHSSRISLGDRYTPEFHLDLPIAEVFEGIGDTNKWWDKLRSNLSHWEKQLSDMGSVFFKSDSDYSLEKPFKNLQEITKILREELVNDIKNKVLFDDLEKFKQLFDNVFLSIESCRNRLKEQGDDGDDIFPRDHQRLMYRFTSNTEALFASSLDNQEVDATLSRSLLLIGEAGIGKSHLLCDVSFHRLENKSPTLFLLGQHYSGGNPLDFILDSLDLKNHDFRQVLGALDSLGESSQSRTLIIIDAINEGLHRDDWENQISGFISELNTYPNIAVILSCRTTYVNYIIPDSVINNQVTKIIHHGFRGYEHRAAEKYLSQQGISKPSAPITAPEFTNPLFLKTCCKALKDNGETAFPRGLQGISKLFDFYISSVEHIVAKKKRYRSGEEVVSTVLKEISNQLYPDNLFGLPVKNSRALINEIDPKPTHGENLLDILIDEGVLAEDIVPSDISAKGIPVIRFTYERFSDHFVAHNLVEKYVTDNNVEDAFKSGQPLAEIFESNNFYRMSGILAALSIIIVEKYNKELVDLIPIKTPHKDWIFDKLFTGTLLWRSGNSFTKRTLELLNKVSSYGHSVPSLDILLSLATEPNHPWNAELLNRILLKRTLPERDSFWSPHIAISDYSEDEGSSESALRSLIDWTYSGNLDGVEKERIRLSAITLIWVTSTTNRRVRDHATKALVRLLSSSPDLLEGLLVKFKDIDDLYILERLYAVAYGVVTNITNDSVVTSITNHIYKELFVENTPIPHILLRDYARGIMEFALYKGLLSSEILVDNFRPPYKSAWPLENPSEEEIEKLEGEEYSSSIKISLMGFVGDFGNYTMSCIHDWSPTSIDNGSPESEKELQVKFGETLQKSKKKLFIKYLTKKELVDNLPFNYSKWMRKENQSIDAEVDDTERKIKEEELESLKAEFESTLDTSQKEQYRWVMGLGRGRSNSTGAFSRKWAQRWVCKRAYELGWDEELFEEFENTHAVSQGRYDTKIERISKKYQWIAFHEFLAHLADNCCYIDKGYCDVDTSQYRGPWMPHIRDIDPTIWLRETGDSDWDEWKGEHWWQPYSHNFQGEILDELKEWLWDENNLPPFEKLLQVKGPTDKTDWVILRGFMKWSKKPNGDEDKIPEQDTWYRINTVIVSKKDVRVLEKKLEGSSLGDPRLVYTGSTGHQGYFKEFPWHESCGDIVDWHNDDCFSSNINLKNLSPVAKYEWESSTEASIGIYMPSRVIIEELGLSSLDGSFGEWVDQNDSTVFLDPSVENSGPSMALMNKDVLFSWLEKNDYQLIWLVGGEKQLFTKWATKFFGRLNFSGFYKLTSDGIFGNIWSEKETPPK